MPLDTTAPNSQPQPARSDPDNLDFSGAAVPVGRCDDEAEDREALLRAVAAQAEFANAENFYKHSLLQYVNRRHSQKESKGSIRREIALLVNDARQRYLSVSDEGLFALAAQVRLAQISQWHLIAFAGLVDFEGSESSRHQEELEAMEAQSIAHLEAAVVLGKQMCVYNAWVRLAVTQLKLLGVQHADVVARCIAGDVTNQYLAAPKSRFDAADNLFQQTLAGFKIDRVPQTSSGADRIAQQIAKVADAARNEFVALTDEQTGFWAIAALVRAGDVRAKQAELVNDIPIPMAVLPSERRTVNFQSRMSALAISIVDQAVADWKRARDEGELLCTKNVWTQLARQRLAKP